MKEFNFEIYTKHPETGETGWDIFFVSVFAETKEEAKQILKTIPNYDCIIAFNYSHDVDMSNLNTSDLQDINRGYCYTK